MGCRSAPWPVLSAACTLHPVPRATLTSAAIRLYCPQDMHPQVTLVVCALACILLKQPIAPHDLVRWALSGQLPYMGALSLCSPFLSSLDPVTAAPLRLLLSRHTGVAGPGALMRATDELAQLLQLELPLVNGPLLLCRACSDLVLPEVCRGPVPLARVWFVLLSSRPARITTPTMAS